MKNNKVIISKKVENILSKDIINLILILYNNFTKYDEVEIFTILCESEKSFTITHIKPTSNIQYSLRYSNYELDNNYITENFIILKKENHFILTTYSDFQISLRTK